MTKIHLLILAFLLIFTYQSQASLKTKDLIPPFPPDHTWIGSEALARKDLEGSVLLFYFWNFSSPSTAREIEFLNLMQDKYGGEGLKIIGVHVPEFEFEKISGEVQKAYQRLKINHPVVLDSGNRISSLFGNVALPSYYFVDSSQRIRKKIEGEALFTEKESWVLKLMAEVSLAILDVELEPFESPPAWSITPDLYFGFTKASAIGNRETIRAGNPVTFRFPDLVEEGRIYLNGVWRPEAEFMHLEKGPGTVKIHFKAFKVYLVAGSKNSATPVLQIHYEGVPLDPKLLGSDVVLNKENKSTLGIGDYRAYQIIDSKLGFQDGTLEIVIPEEGVDLYCLGFR